MMYKGLTYLLAVALFSISIAVGTPSKLSEADLAAISGRGILLAGYDTAAGQATGASRSVSNRSPMGGASVPNCLRFFHRVVASRVPVRHSMLRP